MTQKEENKPEQPEQPEDERARQWRQIELSAADLAAGHNDMHTSLHEHAAELAAGHNDMHTSLHEHAAELDAQPIVTANQWKEAQALEAQRAALEMRRAALSRKPQPFLHPRFNTAAEAQAYQDEQMAREAARTAVQDIEALKAHQADIEARTAALEAEQLASPELSTRQARQLLHARVLERFNRAHGQNNKIRLEDICAEMGDSYEAVRKYRSRKGKGKKDK